ncbi:hypothetical protein Rsub_03379 [Raphidocelis subcapitata]|uniref:FAD-binding domain-containing protein n=1 Tax=Raphidocelis subcapitata TaxID=307507 RepID=A0A2V0NRH4_9CHLO|nr:hypothetical protein Rsub_03379 [Raphidocelis subcapitata]|eukprot:GBF90246.1 hypothetical protein Rsub_03379 [Raphidocelis subcapitata]
MLDVAIVGGGPGGLALARALQVKAPALRVQVFERASGLHKRGAGVAIAPNGTAALRAIDPPLADKILATSLERNLVVVEDAQGREMSRQLMTFGALGKAPGQAMDGLIPWHAMQRLLAESLGEGAVAYRKAFAGLDLAPAGGGAVVRFADGSSAAARLVVGADGLLSQVREAWLGDGGPTFDNRVIFRGQARSADVAALAAWAAGVGGGEGGGVPDSRICPTGQDLMAMVYMLSEGVTVWAVNAGYGVVKDCGVDYAPYARSGETRASLMEPEAAGAACFEEALKLADKLPATVLRVADPSTTTIHGDYVRYPKDYPDTALGAGPVTLVGDAFHPLKVAGQGANLAFEDAAVLAHHLAAAGPTEAALRAYEAERLPRLRTLAEFNITTMNSAAKAAGQDYQELKRRQAEFEEAVVHAFPPPGSAPRAAPVSC